MKYLYFLSFLIIFISCHPTRTAESIPTHLVKLLVETEEIRFRKPEQVEVMLSDCLVNVEEVDNDELWAQYYFVLAHVEMAKGHFDEVFRLADSVNTCPAFVADYRDRIDLMYALVYERLLLYEPAYEYFNSLARQNAGVKLTHDEMLNALLGKARIEFWLMSDYKSTFKEAKQFATKHNDVDKGLFYLDAALFDARDKRFGHLRMSEQCALNEDCYYQLLQRYVQHAAYCQQQDSIDVYLSKAMHCLDEYGLESMYRNTYIEASYLELKSNSLYAHGSFDEAMSLAQKGIDMAIALKLEDKAYRMCAMLSEVQFEMAQYALAMQSKDKAMEYRVAYLDRLKSDKIKYLDVKDTANHLKKENDGLLSEKKRKTIQLRLFLAYSLIVSFSIYFFYITQVSHS